MNSFGEKLITENVVYFVMAENCPFQCAHCMRGYRQPNHISEDVIDEFLSQIVLKGIVCLGGGEPLMNTKKVIYLIEQLYNTQSNLSYISLMTSGSVNLHKFEKFIAAVERVGFDIYVKLSNDDFHKDERIKLYGKNNVLEIYEEYKKVLLNYGFDESDIVVEEFKDYENGEGVFAIGKGANIPGAQYNYREFRFNRVIKLIDNNIRGKLQVNPNGIISPYFDMSWKERNEYYNYSENNILNNSLREILTKNHCK